MAMQMMMDNVISLSTASGARRRGVKPESVGVLNDCRDIALKRITEVLAGTFDKIEDELFEMAEKSDDRESQNMYLDARAQAREKRGDIESSFRRQFLSFFEKKVIGSDETVKKPAVDYGAMELSLVDDTALEENLAVNDIAKRISDKCDDELRALSQRMGFLLSEPELDDDANPMSPDTIVKALKAACDQMTSGYQTKLTVMRLVEQHMSREMLGVYRDINSHLVSRQILPQIRPSYRKTQTSVVRKTPAANASSPASEGATTPPSNAAADVFSTLQQLIAGGAAFDSSLAAGSAAPPAFGVNTGNFAPMPPQPGVSPLDAMRMLAETSASITSAGLVSALTQMQQQFGGLQKGGSPGAALNVLREIKSLNFVHGSSPMDVMTIDIVAMLFDYVFDDKAIPDSVKGLLARLQIPALKVAILDKSFFSKKTHPARRLLDSLAEASMGFAGAADAADPLYRKIESVVDRVHSEFETDIQLFADVLADFEFFLAERETASADFIEMSARAVHEREKREMARMIAVDEIERRTVDADLPPAVTSMLRGPWARVLERVYLRDSGRNARFQHVVETADHLIWSVAPKKDADERKRLVNMLPTLLRNLQEGMDIATVETEDRQRFFASLVDCHAAAVKAGLRGESVAALLAATQPTTEMGPLFAKLMAEEEAREAALKQAARSGAARIHFTDHGVEIEEISAAKAANADDASETAAPESLATDAAEAAPVDFDITEMPVMELKRGTWVEFLQDGGKCVRAKLSWISPLKGVYLFTNPGASEALSIAPDALQLQFHQGRARRIDESSLIDRAVDRMVHSLQEAAHA